MHPYMYIYVYIHMCVCLCINYWKKNAVSVFSFKDQRAVGTKSENDI